MYWCYQLYSHLYTCDIYNGFNSMDTCCPSRILKNKCLHKVIYLSNTLSLIRGISKFLLNYEEGAETFSDTQMFSLTFNFF